MHKGPPSCIFACSLSLHCVYLYRPLSLNIVGGHLTSFLCMHESPGIIIIWSPSSLRSPSSISSLLLASRCLAIFPPLCPTSQSIQAQIFNPQRLVVEIEGAGSTERAQFKSIPHPFIMITSQSCGYTRKSFLVGRDIPV